MTGLVELWRTPGGAWRWRWVDASGISILANRSWDAMEDAHQAAARAYPGEVVILLDRPPLTTAGSRVARGPVRVLGLLAGLALLVGILIVIGRLTLRARSRRNLPSSIPDLRKPTRR